jgi:hypothetical protein
MRLSAAEVTTSRHPVTRAVLCSAILGNRLVHHAYYGYTVRDAVRLFVADVNSGRI